MSLSIDSTPENPIPPKPPRELDPSLFIPSSEELEFLHKTVSPDENEIRKRVLDVQQKAYSSYPYPCIRAFHFTSLMMSQNEVYNQVVDRGKEGKSLFLDLGCCMGTDLRKLALDGYKSTNLIGCDLRRDFIDIGFQLFNDADTCLISFLTSDIFTLAPTFASDLLQTPLNSVKDLNELKGRMMHIYVGALFHLFDEDAQFALACLLIPLLEVVNGAVIFGRHQGVETAAVLDDHMGRARFGHSPASWKDMWLKAFSALMGTEFARNNVIVQTSLVERPAIVSVEGQKSHYFMFWSVTIVR